MQLRASILSGIYIWFWSVQIPVLNSSYLTFHVTTGAFAAFWARFDVFELGFGADLASQFEVDLMTSGPLAVGANILAITIVLFLSHIDRIEFRR